MVPDGWTETTLADVAASPISYGVVQTGENLTEGVPCVRVVDMASGSLDPSTMITTSQEISASYSRTVLQQDDILIALRGIIGRAVIASARLEGCNLTRGIARISPKRSEFSPSFLFQAINGPRFKNYIERQANGSALQEISIGTLRKAKIIVPKQKKEQERIAEILSTWDRAIDVTERLIANSQAQKKALMQQLLTGKRRLPGFNGEWRHTSFEDLFEIVIGGTPSRSNPTYWVNEGDNGFPWIAISDLKRKYISSSKERVTEEGAQNSNVKWLDEGTIVLSFKLSIGKTAILSVGAYTNEAICGLVPRSRGLVDKYFVYHMLEHMDLEESVDQAVKGKTLNKSKLRQLRLWHPSIDEQRNIGSAIETADTHLEALKLRCSALKMEKAALMQQLLTGKRRVKVEETAA